MSVADGRRLWQQTHEPDAPPLDVETIRSSPIRRGAAIAAAHAGDREARDALDQVTQAEQQQADQDALTARRDSALAAMNDRTAS